MKPLMTLLCLTLVVFAAQDSTQTFEDRDWKLAELNGEKLPEKVRVIPHLRFSKGRVAGNAGCNQFFATYVAREAALRIEKIGSTMMACAPPEVEQPTLKALSATASYRVVNDSLELRDQDGKVRLKFVAR